MPNWNAVLKEIEKAQSSEPGTSPFDVVRRKYLAQLHQHTGRNIIGYYSGFLTKDAFSLTSLNDEDKNGFMLCVHKLDKSKGLDLILHTPGGDIGAVESIIFYLRQMFGSDIRAIIPQLAMSAGTIIACSCREILMGKHSAIGPVDPQIDGIPAVGLLREFERALEDVKADERSAMIWDPILSNVKPGFIEQCRWAVDRSTKILADVLREAMFIEMKDSDREILISKIVDRLNTHQDNLGHDKHIHYQECIDLGLKISLLEDPKDKILQDLVLTVHHTYMHTLSNTQAAKIIENHMGRAHVRLLVSQQPIFQLSNEINERILSEIEKTDK